METNWPLTYTGFLGDQTKLNKLAVGETRLKIETSKNKSVCPWNQFKKIERDNVTRFRLSTAENHVAWK